VDIRVLAVILAVALGTSVAVRIARSVALKRALLDVPNERSSLPADFDERATLIEQLSRKHGS